MAETVSKRIKKDISERLFPRFSIFPLLYISPRFASSSFLSILLFFPTFFIHFIFPSVLHISSRSSFSALYFIFLHVLPSPLSNPSFIFASLFSSPCFLSVHNFSSPSSFLFLSFIFFFAIFLFLLPLYPSFFFMLFLFLLPHYPPLFLPFSLVLYVFPFS